MSEKQQLDAIREQIDAVDQELQNLINRRAALAQEVARIKLSADPDTHFYRPEREADVLRTVKSRNQGPLDNEEIARLFREIMSACLALEKTLMIAFLGPEGTFTQAAALKHFGHSVGTVPFNSIADVFREVESGSCDYGVVPVENSTEGIVSHTLDMFLNSPLVICGEVVLRIHHNLLGLPECDWKNAKTIYSHQQSLGQCRHWLDQNLPHAERISYASNAEAARYVAATGDGLAIASSEAATLYKLQNFAANIEDEPGNTTRFLIIGKIQAGISGQDKTSLLLSTRNEAGGLHRLLTPLAEHGISMTRIESRPSRRGMWDYVFFVDHEQDDMIVGFYHSVVVGN